MAAVVGNGTFQPFDDLSQPPSHSSSPNSPTFSAHSQSRTTNGSSFLEPPPGTSFSDFLGTWDDALVARWLSDIKCGHLASTFSANDIRGDVLLELDQVILKEMGMTSVGDRLRVLNGVKSLRQRCSSANAALVSITNRPRVSELGRSNSLNGDGSSFPGRALGHRRLDSGRPAPLHLTPAGGSPDPSLPRIIRDGSESSGSTQPANSSSSSRYVNGIRPLPQQPGSGSSTHSTPTTSHSVRANLPPLPPPPRGQPPLPPNPRTPHNLQPPPSVLSGRRTPIPSDGSPYSPHTSNLLTPSSGSQGARTPLRSQSPQLPFPSMASNRNNAQNNAHNRSGSLNNPQPAPPVKLPPRPSTGSNTHPYAQNGAPASLSPIAESYNSQRNNMASSTPSPPTGPYNRNGIVGPIRPNTPQNNGSYSTPSLDDLRRKLVKFALPDEGKSATINVADCAGGVEVLIKALKKFNKLGSRADGESERVETEDGGLSVDGWGVYLNGGEDVSGSTSSPLTEAQLLSICHAPPDDPSRENGLTLRLIGRRGHSPSSRSGSPAVGARGNDDDEFLAPNRMPMSTKATKRASSISILSGLGVPNPEKALEPDASTSTPTQSPTETPATGQRPAAKLRNFFGQRPPSELITTHLPEYFPNADKKVLERTRRQSMMRMGMPYKRDSVASWNAPQSRYSVSTMGSQRGSARLSTASASPMIPDRTQSALPPAPEPKSRNVPPRLSLSTDDGSAIDLETDESYKRLSSPHILPPVTFPSESLSESLNLDASQPENRRQSRTLSTASKRMSYITELRSKRDRSDTASLMTVDEITASVESRRESTLRPDSDGSDEWTQVDAEDDAEKRSIMDRRTRKKRRKRRRREEETEEEDNGTIEDGAALSDEEETGKTTISATRERTIKWIKGALIGAGSFGKVYLGMDASTGLLMAVKQVELPTGSAPNEERKKSMLSALEREIELLQELQHENIVQYLSSCIDDDHLNIFLEYVPGGSVTSVLRNYGAFEEPLVRNWVRQILLGLNYLHERDIIHRDIKGANMLVDNKGGIKISDFGISKKVEDNLLPGHRAHRPSLQGSVFWMAPEVVKQTAYTQKADIWSVGCLVVEMLTGEHPWAQLTQMQAIFKVYRLFAKPTIPADISPEAENFLQLTFELNHEARPSAAELLKHPWVANQSLLGH
ncbi:uncharacterized protein B0H18DRAFT_876670 [Fomitopsis serialis]|uniref:uncharacterized protein n=1 Tax=Fomitopsis serialis TaxID=139415 RepID=UPI002008E314|nr:uncharacterized protein B0H18DRAFT_876670 [Neoantrodia serialis]KAH9926195.1 hypothetical protein B0H18DRAFT_876670 [Neoantrodia serialis]